MSSESESESRKLGSEEISREFKTLVSSNDLHSLNHMQHTILGRLQDSNAVLSHFNDFSHQCFAEISGDIARNTRVLKSVKSDLDYIFQKLSLSNTTLSIISYIYMGYRVAFSNSGDASSTRPATLNPG
ncbi:hypothetical protein Fmac_004470 [Flemingia macrophylla]|uniref:KxDL domain-containing protein n=1 Tax=Flemingia macrophylla TaxID=520843 RepID=A0ABD1N515_9FABA